MMSKTNQPENEPMAVVINTRKMAMRCSECEAQVDELQQRIDAKQVEVDQMQSRIQEQETVAAIGEREIANKKQKILTGLRAIVLYSGDRERLSQMETQLASSTIPPDMVERFYQSIQQELQSLYPIQPRSKALSAAATGSASSGLKDFQFQTR